MVLDLADKRIRARLTTLSDGRIRFTIDTPPTGQYHRRVMTAIADLIRPPTPHRSEPLVGTLPEPTQ